MITTIKFKVMSAVSLSVACKQLENWLSTNENIEIVDYTALREGNITNLMVRYKEKEHFKLTIAKDD